MKIKVSISSILTLVLISGVLQVFAAGDKSEGLVFYYDYAEINNGKVADQSGNGYDGEIEGNITIVEDPEHGKVAKFESGSYLKLEPEKVKKDGNIPTNAFSILAWVNVENNGAHHAIFNARSADNTWLTHPEIRVGEATYRWLLRAAAGNKIFDMKAGSPKPGKWVHYAGTYDRKKKPGAILFIDGKPVGEAAGDLPVSADWDQGARVGFNIDNKRPFTGMMDEVSVWEYGFSQEEIQEIIEKGLDGFLAVNPVEKLATTWATVKSSR